MEEFVPFDEGKNYPTQWKIQLILSIVGLIINVIVVQCFCIIPYYFVVRLRTVMGLFLACSVFFCYQIIKTSNNLLHNKFVGDHLGCKVDAAINSTLFLWKFMVIVLVSDTMRKDFTSQPSGNRETLMRLLLYGSYSGVIGALAVSLPGSSYYLDPTGMWCFLDFNSTVTIIVFVIFGLTIPILNLSRNIHAANTAVKNAQEILILEGNLSQAKVRQVRVLKFINKSLFAFIFIEAPIISFVLIQWITSKRGPIYLDLIATDIHFIYFCLLPIQSVIMLYEVKMTFWIIYGPYIDTMKSIVYRKSAAIDIVSQIHEYSNIHDDWRFWLENDSLKTYFFTFPSNAM